MISKKSWLVVGIFIFIVCFNVIAQEDGLPNDDFAVKMENSGLEFDEDTGVPKGFSEFQANAELYRTQEQNSSYLFKEWGKILADAPVIGPALYYAEKFFSFFNFLWVYTFGMEFEWSLAFFFHLIVWGVLTWVVFISMKASELLNPLFSFITGMIVASITGSFGIISVVVKIIDTMVGDLLMLTVFVVILIIVLILFERLIRKLKGENEEEKLERADRHRETAGEIAKRFLGNFGGGTES